MKKRTSSVTHPKPVSRSKPGIPKASVPSATPSRSPIDRETASAPQTGSYWRTYRFYLLAFAAAVLMVGLCAWMVRRQAWLGREIALFRRINDWPEKVRPVFVAVTALGSVWAAAVLVGAAFGLRLYSLAWRLALSIITAYGLLLILKEFFARARPEFFIGNLHVRVVEHSFAFPSAHAAIATVLALTLRTYLPVPAMWQWAIAVLWIGGVTLSRVYLGVHAPLDVAAGVALGVGVVCFWPLLPKAVKRVLRIK